MIYPLVDVLKKAYPVTQVCEALSLPKSSYYYWQAHREPPVTRQHLQVRVQAIHAQVNQTYGSRRMSDALKADGLAVGRHQAGTLMREVGAVAVRPKKRHVYPKAGEVSRIADNHLSREFDAAQPNQKWVGDITYLWTATGWMYLAVVLDLFSRTKSRRLQARSSAGSYRTPRIPRWCWRHSIKRRCCARSRTLRRCYFIPTRAVSTPATPTRID